MDQMTQFQINHNNKNVIDLEDTSSSDTDIGKSGGQRKMKIHEDDLVEMKKLDEGKPILDNSKMLTGIMSKGQQK